MNELVKILEVIQTALDPPYTIHGDGITDDREALQAILSDEHYKVSNYRLVCPNLKCIDGAGYKFLISDTLHITSSDWLIKNMNFTTTYYETPVFTVGG